MIKIWMHITTKLKKARYEGLVFFFSLKYKVQLVYLKFE